MRDRLKFKIDTLSELIATSIPVDVLTNKAFRILDPAIAGGQIVSAVEKQMTSLGISDSEISTRVFGFEEDSMAVDYAINRHKLKGKYQVSNSRPNMNADIVVGNPPYNDGSKARNPIYHLFLENFSKNPPEYLSMVIQANWFTQPDNKLGKSVRSSLKKLGVFKIVINPYDTFETAKVKTCTVFCRRGYTGNVILVDGDTGNQTIITNLDNVILYTVDSLELSILNNLKPAQPWKTFAGNKGNPNKWRIATSYRKENFDVVPLNPLKLMEPNYQSQSGYRVFAEFDTEDQAKQALEWYKSFWHSKLVTWILKKTRTSTTLDNPQIIWIPKVAITQTFTDKDLYAMFNLNQQQIDLIEAASV